MEGRGIAAPHHDHEEEEGRLPTLGTDFFHMGQSDEPVLPMIAAKEKATKMLFAHMLPSKEVGQHVVDVTKDDIEFLGLKRFVYKSDGEPAIKAVKTAVTESLPTTSTVMPEESPVEDHQANGDIENAIREIGKEIRTLKSATESKIGRRIASNHPILAWLPAHAAFLISRYAVGADGKTAYERSRGKKYKRELVPFAERIHFIVPGPKRHMNKLESKWSTGRFVGCVQRTNEMLVMTDRGVVKARSVKRMTEQERWKTDDWDQIVGRRGSRSPRRRQPRRCRWWLSPKERQVRHHHRSSCRVSSRAERDASTSGGRSSSRSTARLRAVTDARQQLPAEGPERIRRSADEGSSRR